MHDPRIYRAALLPALLALVVAAFSLQAAPRASTTTLAPDAFNGARAFRTLEGLAAEFPHRRPGSAGDRALADRVAAVMRSSGFEVSTREVDAGTIDGTRTLRTVIGVRPGLSSQRIVVLAHRDAAASPATADLSGTAGLIELARVFAGRTPHKTLVLVSTSGGSGGAAGAADWAEHRVGPGPVEAALVLGDLAGDRLRPPLVVPWSDGDAIAPLRLRRTVEEAMRTELGRGPGETRGLAQLARLAVPLTVGEQGELGERGLPAVLISAAGERGPGAETSVSESRLQGFGRAVLRSVTALDETVDPIGAPHAEVLLRTKVVPAWAVRLVAAALILPVLFAAVDGFARARRRREHVAMGTVWALSSALPFVLAIAIAFLLRLAGLIAAAPPAPVPPGALPLGAAGAAALALLAAVLVLGFRLLRPRAMRAVGVRVDRSAPGAAVALLVVVCVLVVVVWASNPFAGLLLVPALHLWMVAVAPDVRIPRAAAVALTLAGAVPLVLIAVYDAAQLGVGPLGLAWTAVLLVVGGHVGLVSALAWSLLLGCFGCVLAVAWARGNVDEDVVERPTTRGPASYAGPGSLGGTESALRR